MGVLEVTTILLAFGKLTGYIDVSWLIVAAPEIGALTLYAIIAICTVIHFSRRRKQIEEMIKDMEE